MIMSLKIIDVPETRLISSACYENVVFCYLKAVEGT